MNTTSNQHKFGEVIRNARENTGWGMREAALKMSINPGYLGAMEHNLYMDIPIQDHTLRKISQFLNINYEELRTLAIARVPELKATKGDDAETP